MGQYNRRRDHLVAEPIVRHVWDWVNANGGRGTGHAWKHGNRWNEQIAPYTAVQALADLTGYERTTIDHLLKRRFIHIHFDKADKLLCAIGQPNLWFSDPELRVVYKRACQGADAINPIADAA